MNAQVTAAGLTADQQQALELLLPALVARRSAALVGPAGTGKTFLLRHLLAAAAQQGLNRVVLVSPTWRAARVALDAIGMELPTTTVASILQLRPSVCSSTGRLEFRTPFRADPYELGMHQALSKGCDLLVIEEASMVDRLAGARLRNVAEVLQAACLFVGDAAQLPPVRGSHQQGHMALTDERLNVVARLDEVVRNGGAILQLATQLRHHSVLSRVWPNRSQLDPGGDTGVVVHPAMGTWLAAAAETIATDAWLADPDRGRVLAWSNRVADRLAQELRRRHYGKRAEGEWIEGELLMAPGGLPELGNALGKPQAPACSEFTIQAITPLRLEEQRGAYRWFTPKRHTPRDLRIEAAADVLRLELRSRADGRRCITHLEPPGQRQWRDQVKALRKAVRDHLPEGADRAQALRELLDLDALVPPMRPAGGMTLHASQGGSYRAVWVADDIGWCNGPEQRALAYVGVSRAQKQLHLLRIGGRAG